MDPAPLAPATATSLARPAPPPHRVAPRRIPRRRLVLLGMGGASLLAGLDAALLLADLPAPVGLDRLADVHGQLMLLGFLGTLVSLERAVALRTRWALLAPALLGAGGILLLTALPTALGSTVQAFGAATLVAVYAGLWRRAGSVALLTQWLGALLLAGAALLWAAGVATPVLVPMFAGFLVLTIAGERLELARIAGPGPAAEHALLGLACLTVLSAMGALLWPAPGTELTGVAMLGITVWLLRHDVALRTLHATGLPRYAAVNIVAGIGWLAVAGAAWLLLGFQESGPGYDLVVHAVGLGFAMSMVLAHAPIILPAVLLRPLPYRPVLYASTVLLQGSLVLRAVGDLRELPSVWQAGSAANVVALVVFLLTAVALVVRR